MIVPKFLYRIHLHPVVWSYFSSVTFKPYEIHILPISGDKFRDHDEKDKNRILPKWNLYSHAFFCDSVISALSVFAPSPFVHQRLTDRLSMGEANESGKFSFICWAAELIVMFWMEHTTVCIHCHHSSPSIVRKGATSRPQPLDFSLSKTAMNQYGIRRHCIFFFISMEVNKNDLQWKKSPRLTPRMHICF
jgi:hypothetical protein